MTAYITHVATNYIAEGRYFVTTMAQQGEIVKDFVRMLSLVPKEIVRMLSHTQLPAGSTIVVAVINTVTL